MMMDLRRTEPWHWEKNVLLHLLGSQPSINNCGCSAGRCRLWGGGKEFCLHLNILPKKRCWGVDLIPGEALVIPTIQQCYFNALLLPPSLLWTLEFCCGEKSPNGEWRIPFPVNWRSPLVIVSRCEMCYFHSPAMISPLQPIPCAGEPPPSP